MQGRMFLGKSAARNMPDDVMVQRIWQVNPVCHHWRSVSNFMDLGTDSLMDFPYYHCLNAFKILFIISL